MTELLITLGEHSKVKDFIGPRGIAFETITPKKPEGRPTKKTPETVRKLEEAFIADCNISEACLYAGISRNTYYEMLKENPEYIDRFEQLRDSVALRARKAIALGADQNYDNAFRYMVKKRPEEYGDRLKLDHSGDVTTRQGMTPEVEKVIEEMNVKMREALAAPHKPT